MVGGSGMPCLKAVPGPFSLALLYWLRNIARNCENLLKKTFVVVF